ncbi:prolipoprotein diacylglyceryl transferase [Candidatus Woesearchaeota archaeon]|nr:prolipoprotein diacylglyceryl transferase [Candidatus Woesearchaeota archaeon]
MFVHNIDPNLFTIGPFSVRFYGIVYALGFLLASHLLVKAAENKKIRNLDKEKAMDIAVYAMVGALLGARIFHVITDFHLYRNNLLGMLAIWNGGLGFQGGLIGGMLAAYLYSKKHKINMFRVMDIIVVPLPLVLAFGRMANFLNSEHLGFPTDLPWCVVFQRIDNVCRHPAQLYQSLSQLILFGAMLLLSRTKMSKKAGNLSWSFITGYGVIRFITDFARMNHSFYVFGLSHTQLLSIAMIFIGSIMIYKNNHVKNNKVKK